jgi:hypothetical protein
MWNLGVRRARRLTSAMVSPPFPPRFVPPLFLSASHTTSFLASRSPSHESPSPFPAKTPVSHRRARPGIRGTIALMLLHWMPYTAWSALRDIGDSLIFSPLVISIHIRSQLPGYHVSQALPSSSSQFGMATTKPARLRRPT